MEKQVKVSALAANYPASGIRKMFDLASHYPKAIKLTVGEPNFDTPQYVKDAAKEAIDAGMVHYTPNAGIDELRQAVAKRYVRLGSNSPPGQRLSLVLQCGGYLWCQ